MWSLIVLLLAAPLQLEVLAPGVEYGTTQWIEKPTISDGLLHVVRIDPKKVKLEIGLASRAGLKNRTAGEWADGLGLMVAINAGMFETDYRSNVGYLRSGAHLNNPRWNTYQSALAFGPGTAFMADLDAPDAKQRLEPVDTVIQNLRLIRAGGVNVWKPGPRKWSEAAVAADDQGRILFLFSRSPLSMKEFADKLLAMPLHITHAMHVEGGPEASLSIRAGSRKIDLSGSYETGFNENDGNAGQWPLPNVIGVVPR